MVFSIKTANVIRPSNRDGCLGRADGVFTRSSSNRRYKLGHIGSNDPINFKYHKAVLKSTVPFKFGINVSVIRPDEDCLGGARSRRTLRWSALSPERRYTPSIRFQDIFVAECAVPVSRGRLRIDRARRPLPSRARSDSATPSATLIRSSLSVRV